MWLQVTVVARTQNLALRKLMKKEQFPSWCCICHSVCSYGAPADLVVGTTEAAMEQSHYLLEKMILFQSQLKISILFRSDWKYFKGFGTCFSLQRTLVCILCSPVPPPHSPAGLEQEWVEALLADQFCSQNWAVNRAPDSSQSLDRFTDLHVDGLMLPPLAWFSVCWGLQLLLISGI